MNDDDIEVDELGAQRQKQSEQYAVAEAEATRAALRLQQARQWDEAAEATRSRDHDEALFPDR